MNKSIPIKKFISADRPFFLYDQRKIISNIKLVEKFMEEMLGTSVSLAFSLKTQPNYQITETIRSSGLSVDVSSMNELDYALTMGFDPKNIFLGGVGLTDASIDQALACDIGGIHLNSARLFEETAVKKVNSSSSVNLSVRFHPSYLRGTKLGETKQDLIDKFGNAKSIDGLHVYVGREAFEQNIVQQIFDDISELVSAQIFQKNWVLYFGPGLPDLEQTKLQSFNIKHAISNIKIEVGRSITSSCGYYGAPVLSVKQFGADRKTVIIDGGLQHFGSPWVTLRQGPMPMNALFFNSNGKQKKVSTAKAAIYGSLCLWHDCLHPSFPIPNDIERGDWIVVPNMGAYGLTAGVPLFIGETLPLEFYFDGKQYLDVTHHGFGKLEDE